MDEEEKEIEMLKKVLELSKLNFGDTFAKRNAKESLEDLLD